MTNLIEPNFIERDPDKITAEWIKLYEEKSGKTCLAFCSTPSSRSLYSADAELALTISALLQARCYGRLRLTQKALQPTQIEQLMIDVGAYRETLLRIEIQEAKFLQRLEWRKR